MVGAGDMTLDAAFAITSPGPNGRIALPTTTLSETAVFRRYTTAGGLSFTWTF